MTKRAALSPDPDVLSCTDWAAPLKHAALIMRTTLHNIAAKIRKRLVKLLDALDRSVLTTALVAPTALTLTSSLFWVLSDSSDRLPSARPVPEAFPRGR